MMNLEDVLEKIHRNLMLRVGLHILFWLGFYSIQYYIGAITFDAFSDTPAAFLSPFRMTFSLIAVYYPLVYYVLPLLLAKGKYLQGTVAITLLIILYTLLDYWCEVLLFWVCRECFSILKTSLPEYYAFLQNSFLNVLLARILTFGIVYQLVISIAVPLGLKLSLIYISQRFRTLKLAKENSQLEFNFLKSQVKPHFLFNTLNNIYGLILQGRKPEAAETVARLADFLRYTLYDSGIEKNNLYHEMQLLNDYIALEKLRLNATRIDFSYEIDLSTYCIPPLLFIPVVENAFKYCMEAAETDSWIQIRLIASQGKVKFVTSNTYIRDLRPASTGGIGLQNLQKRLENNYPVKHRFRIEDQPPVYTVTIEIDVLEENGKLTFSEKDVSMK
jgi:hypothetical protein